ncbi:MAG: hypothetical protein KDA96_26165, partial [Planctomycetaceae bacterium]|nr:hypothetical protein [Planctomycetaceae bacterium]
SGSASLQQWPTAHTPSEPLRRGGLELGSGTRSGPDPILSSARCCIATADSEILNHAVSWFNLVNIVVGQSVPDPWIVDFSPAEPGV